MPKNIRLIETRALKIEANNKTLISTKSKYAHFGTISRAESPSELDEGIISGSITAKTAQHVSTPR